MNLPRKVYAIQHNVTKRLYIGSSKNVEIRYMSHIYQLRKGNHPIEDMQADFNEYGEDFSLFVLEEFASFAERRVEYKWMEKYQSHIRGKGYNYKDPAMKQRERTVVPITPGLPEIKQSEAEVAARG